MNGCGGVAFKVHGKPKTQGSMWSPKGSHNVIHQASDQLKTWRTLVADEGRIAWQAGPIEGRVNVNVTFRFMRPKCHMGTGGNAAKVKDSAPTHHTKHPDVDKLLRAILDALTGVIWIDDKQVNEIHGIKKFVTRDQGALIIIETDPKDD